MMMMRIAFVSDKTPSVHSVEIPEIYSYTFLTKVLWKQRLY